MTAKQRPGIGIPKRQDDGDSRKADPADAVAPGGGHGRALRVSLGIVAAFGVTAGSVSLSGRERSDTSTVSLASAVPEGSLPAVVGQFAKSSLRDAALPPAVPPAARQDRSPPAEAAGAPAGPGFQIGDKLKLAFFERVQDLEQNKWGRPSSSMRGFEQRQELSGEYNVQEDGSIALPLLGSFPVQSRTVRDVQKDLAAAFEALIGHKAVVTIMSLERPPVYVLGPVKTPGAYKYVPGMTVLHAVALAGGFQRQDLEPWQRVEAVREVQKQRGAMDTMPTLMARAAVLMAERDGVAAILPRQLSDLVGMAEAKRLLAQEAERRLSIVAARRSQDDAISSSVEAAKHELRMLTDRAHPMDDLIKLRAERVNAMRSLMTSGVVGRLVLIQAQGELADAEQRRQDAVNQYALAQQRVGQLEQERARIKAETRGNLEIEITATEQQIEANQRELAASEGILGTLAPAQVQFRPLSGQGFRYAALTGTPQAAYEIVHMSPAGPVARRADGMARLQPGDLVRILAEDAAAPAPAPTETRAKRQTNPGFSKVGNRQ